jgi:hypothetical protein
VIDASLVLHGHFYQPPRENPWLDEVEVEQSAAPFHDWNQRIERECYRAVVAARVPGAGNRIARIVNTLEHISFNFGATLMEWLEREAPDTYEMILAADRISHERLGHGNAIAQPYHHAILPLATRRDKTTEVRWGIADFRRRYGRDPEGMWLPETAMDDESLDVLAAEGIQFTIVAPHQVTKPPSGGRPGRYRTRNGHEITLCIYDGDFSLGIAFGGYLHDADAWVEAMLARAARVPPEGDISTAGDPEADASDSETDSAVSAVSTPQVNHDNVVLLSAATDGETYGHHHPFGEMALARALSEMRRMGLRVENFASFLARTPATEQVEIVEPTSWSCPHGVERWRSDCGCRMDGARYPSQAWRGPLRTGLNALADGLHQIFEREGTVLFHDPWAAREAYGAIVHAPEGERLDAFIGKHVKATTAGDIVRARELLEMERDALRMFTSCAWFFDDIGGLEPRQVLRYAARAIALAGSEGAMLERALLDELAKARSNENAIGTGRDVYLTHARQRVPADARLAAAELAARHVNVHHPMAYASAIVRIDGERATVLERRTGRERHFEVHLTSSAPADLAVQVQDADTRGAARVLHLGDFPEAARMEIRSILRRALLPKYLTPAELDHLAAGDVQLRGIVAVALTRAIRKLELELDADAVARAAGLIDLFEQIELMIPFDTQTAFWQVWNAASSERRLALAGLRWRLGFVDELVPEESADDGDELDDDER